MTTHKNLYIGNQWKTASGEPFSSLDPATAETVWFGAAASKSDIDSAVLAAKNAFSSWSKTSLENRKAILRTFAKNLEAKKDKFAAVISQETGKPLWESKTEVSAIINKVEISIEAYEKRCGETIQAQGTGQLVTRHLPHGVIAIFGPSNFPAHLPNGQIIPALLAGNTIIFKPSELTPNVGQMLVELWEEVDLPAGVINLVQGGRHVGRQLAEHPSLNGLFFTGSWHSGKSLAELFSQEPGKILALEMGGNNPLIVTDVSDTKAAAYLTIQSAYLSSGQRCTCARRLIVPEGLQGNNFLTELIDMIKKIKVGPYTDLPEPFMGPVITSQMAERLLSIQDELCRLNGRSIIPMQQIKAKTGLISPGLMDVTLIQERKDEEYFGPFLQLIRVKNFDEAILEANQTNYGLSAGLLSDKKEHYEKFYQNVRAGIINWNTQLTGASSKAPFGGLGRSGNNRPGAYYTADYCAYPVASMENPKSELPTSFPPGMTL